MSPPRPISRTTTLDGVRFETFDQLRKEREGGPRLAFHDGVLEIMSPCMPHEFDKKVLGRMIEDLTEVLGIEIETGGSMTLVDAESRSGFEPDDSFWIQNQSRVREPGFDPQVTPPDLIIESEFTRTLDARMATIAALRIPEVWRYDQQSLRVFLLKPDGHYRESATSQAFPWLPLDQIAEFLSQAAGVDRTTASRRFREWVRADVQPLVDLD